MAWSIWQVDKVTNISGTLQMGGSLAASTDYFVKVVGIDSMSTTRQLVSQFMKNVIGEYSDTFSFTTTATEKQINLTWDIVYKADGVTEVDGYIVLLSTSDNFLTIDNYSKIFVNPSSYYQATTNTNSYTLDTTPTRYWHNLPNGCPYFEWDGASTCTFDSLWDYIQTLANPDYWAQAMFVPNWYTGDRPFAYTFLGEIYVKRYSSDSADGVYSFTMNNRVVAIFGGFSVQSTAKVKAWDGWLGIQGRVLRGATQFFNNVAGNSIKNIILRSAFGDSGTHYTTSLGFIWGVTSQAPMATYPPSSSSVFENVMLSCADNANIFPIYEEYTCSKVVTKGTYQARNRIYYARKLIGRGGSDIKATGGNFWNTNLTDGTVMANSWATTPNYFETSTMHIVDCHWKYTDHSVQDGTKTADGIYPIIQRSSWYNGDSRGKLKKLLNTIWKSIKVIVTDETTKLPIEDAKVYFFGNNVEKLTWGNNEVDIVSFVVPKIDASYNHDPNEVNFTPDDTDVWLQYYLYHYGTLVSELTPGQEYWAGGERIKIIEKLSDVGPASW